jgi:hypothetical protein
MNDHVMLRGHFKVNICRRGIVTQYEDPNMIVELGKDAILKLIAGDGADRHLTHIAIGTHGDGPDPEDEALTNQWSKSLASYSYSSPQEGKRVDFHWSISAGESNGIIIREFGLLSADGTLFARKVHAGIPKDNETTLQGTWSIYL